MCLNRIKPRGEKRGDPVLNNRQLLNRTVLGMLLIVACAMLIVLCAPDSHSQTAENQSGTLTATGGAISTCYPTQTVPGTCIVFINSLAAYGAIFEEKPSGSPTGVSVSIYGCMRGGTCSSVADTNTSTSAINRPVTFSGPYDVWVAVSTTLTGGTAPSITINLKGSAANAHSGINTSAGVVALFTGCSGTEYLGADGACHTAGGSGTVTSVATAGIATGGPVTTTGTVTVAGSGNTTTAATAAANLAGAATGNVATTDGSGNVQSGGTLLSALETTAAAQSAFSGTGSTANKVVTGLNANAAPTSNTVTSAYVDSSICSNAGCSQNTTGTAANLTAAATLPSGTVLPLYQNTATAQAAYAGHGSCTNQVETADNANAAPSCTTITSAYVDSSIAPTNSPTLVSPTLGAATATSVNKVAITAPATSATLTIANGKTLTVNNSLTLSGTDATVLTGPNVSGSIIVGVAGDGTILSSTACTPTAAGVCNVALIGTPTGSGNPVLQTSPTLTTPTLGVASFSKLTAGANGAHINGAAANHDIEGTIAVSSSTSGSVTFTTNYTSAPACIITPTSDPTAIGVWWVTTSTSTVTANVKVSGTISFFYHCFGNPS